MEEMYYIRVIFEDEFGNIEIAYYKTKNKYEAKSWYDELYVQLYGKIMNSNIKLKDKLFYSKKTSHVDIYTESGLRHYFNELNKTAGSACGYYCNQHLNNRQNFSENLTSINFFDFEYINLDELELNSEIVGIREIIFYVKNRRNYFFKSKFYASNWGSGTFPQFNDLEYNLRLQKHISNYNERIETGEMGIEFDYFKFDYNYSCELQKELIVKVNHPSKLIKFLDNGGSIDDFEYIYG